MEVINVDSNNITIIDKNGNDDNYNIEKENI